MVDVGIPGGVGGERATCFPTAINSAGNVVGYGRQANGKQVAFFWTQSDGFTTLSKDSSPLIMAIPPTRLMTTTK